MDLDEQPNVFRRKFFLTAEGMYASVLIIRQAVHKQHSGPCFSPQFIFCCHKKKKVEKLSVQVHAILTNLDIKYFLKFAA